MEQQQIVLNGADTLMTRDPSEVFMIVSGSAELFIVPYEDSRPGRRILLCTVKAEDTIPSLAYRDGDYQEWHFLLCAQHSCVIRKLPYPCTSVLKEHFAAQAHLERFDEEGFEQSIIEHYRKEIVKDKVFIERKLRQASAVRQESYHVIREAVLSRQEPFGSAEETDRAIAYACRCLRAPLPDIEVFRKLSAEKTGVPEAARAAGLICREIVLDDRWYRQDCGVILGYMGECLTVCVPSGFGYRYYRPSDGKKGKITRRTAGSVHPKAFAVSRRLPPGALNQKDLAAFVRKDLSGYDLFGIFLSGLTGILIGMMLPVLNQKIFDDYIPFGDADGIVWLCLMTAAFILGNLMFSIVRRLSEYRLGSRAGYRMQDAVYDRILRLPESFFAGYDSADLANRLAAAAPVVNTLVRAVPVGGIALCLSVVYLVQMFSYSSKLAGAALLMMLIYTICLLPMARAERLFEEGNAAWRAEAAAKLYQYICGIEKIRTADAHDRAIYDYLVPYARSQTGNIQKSRVFAAGKVLEAVLPVIFAMVFYNLMIFGHARTTIGVYAAFYMALGLFFGALKSFEKNLIKAYRIKPEIDRLMPVFDTPCEDTDALSMAPALRGAVSLRHVGFAYPGSDRNVLKDVCLDIKPGEYIGIVGASGCGKSTLIKILLGFYIPDEGRVCYDGNDLKHMNKQALRRQLGVVLQNGQLIAGSIYDNITITAPDASEEEVERVIDAVGLRQDLEQMPMGVRTLLSENAGTISGGQKQRILIARAMMHNPPILVFDEATSALDNLTQATVIAALDAMHATRIVVAHRLSTVQGCDRIIVMENGRIAEEGTYESLLQKRGLFYSLASRQIAE